ncbi:Atrial natriuretic peptide receptor 1 [Merluccius polli]|uniref:Atrial natriuretic peptide receptor 1 n=1 Tax=Merluccius polli TaxID=89951 RepID=A0AA47N0E5_MERPO|nr:Atrial natriuretic peptide receptor 1 [Merluccius polli]
MVHWKDNPRLMLVLMVSLVLLLGSQWVHGWSSQHPGSRHSTRGHHDRQQLQNITLAIILPQKNTDYPWAWPRIGPAVERAIQTINSDSALLPNHHLTYVFKNSENEDGICSESVAPLMAVDLKLAYDPWAFIGPGCSYSASPVGLFTTHWKVPMVTAGAPAIAFDKVGDRGKIYPSITNTGPTHKKLGKFALRICEKFGWREHVLLLFSDSTMDDRPCYFAVEGLFTELREVNITVVDIVLRENKPVNYSDIIPDIQQSARGNARVQAECGDLLSQELAPDPSLGAASLLGRSANNLTREQRTAQLLSSQTRQSQDVGQPSGFRRSPPLAGIDGKLVDR